MWEFSKCCSGTAKNCFTFEQFIENCFISHFLLRQILCRLLGSCKVSVVQHYKQFYSVLWLCKRQTDGTYFMTHKLLVHRFIQLNVVWVRRECLWKRCKFHGAMKFPIKCKNESFRFRLMNLFDEMCDKNSTPSFLHLRTFNSKDSFLILWKHVCTYALMLSVVWNSKVWICDEANRVIFSFIILALIHKEKKILYWMKEWEGVIISKYTTERRLKTLSRRHSEHMLEQ